MRIRSKAPLRLGLAGGGTDIDAYCRNYGGRVVNVTIGLYAHTTIIKSHEKIKFYCKKNNIIIKNLSRSGILDVYE